MGKGDVLAAGGFRATYGPFDVTQAKWEAIFGISEKKPKQAKRRKRKSSPSARLRRHALGEGSET